jgi:hypothetical protein
MCYKCKECGAEFETRRSLHAHIKKHSLYLGEYYVKHHNKRDPWSGENIPFKNYEQYISQDFRSRENMAKWLLSIPPERAKKYIIQKKFLPLKDKNNLKSAPCSFEIHMRDLPDVETISALFGSYASLCKEIGLPMMFPKTIKDERFHKDWEDVEIIVDTREQKPLKFANSVRKKLDFGDYALASGGKTFVERKSAADFKSTLTGGYERFEREILRCVEFGGFLFVVVDSSLRKLEEENIYSPHKVNLKYLYHNTKTLQHKYKGYCQFVFSGGREKSKKLIPRLLVCDETLWESDVNYFWNELCGN